ncbi:MAG: NADPH-dependent FMN reductase [Cyanobacteriota bacterium]
MIEIISGTNRAGCYSLRIAELLLAAYRAHEVETNILNLQELPAAICEPTAYASKPVAFLPFQERVLAAGGLHVVTPEYNGGMPGALKLFIDMLKFPESFEGKPVAFTGVASGQWGAVRPVEQLQLVFGYRNALTYPQRVFIPGVQSKFEDAGSFNDPELLQRLNDQAGGFARFVNRLADSGSGPG